MHKEMMRSMIAAVALAALSAGAREKVIFDTDIGGDPDDGMALMYLLREPACELLGITTSAGRPESCARVASALCRALGRDDVPIHAGCSRPVHRGMDLTPKAPPKCAGWPEALANWPHDEIAADCSAVEFLRRTIRANPGEVTLFTSCQYSNVMALFTVDPEIPSLLKRLVVVGGNFDGKSVEWNALVDVFATAGLLEGGTRKPPKSLILHGAEVTMPIHVSPVEGRAFMSASPDFAFIRGYYAEQWYARPFDLFFHDPIAAVSIFHPEIMTYEPSAVRVDVADRGRTFRTKPSGDSTWVWQTATSVDFEKFKSIFLSAMTPLAAKDPEMTVSFTFDDGAKDHLTEIAPLLERNGWRGAFNVPTDWVGRKGKLSWDDLRELKRRGHEIVPHGAAHTNLVQLLAQVGAEAVRADIVRSREAMRKELGEVPRFFCLPFNACNAQVAALVREAGMEPMNCVRPSFGCGTAKGTNRSCGFALDRAHKQGRRHLDLMVHGALAPSWGAFADRAELEAFFADVKARATWLGVRDYAVAHPTPGPAEHGVLFLTFDDRHFASWEAALPVFEKYGAHASFFVAGAIDAEALKTMRRLRAEGHTVGIHTVGHGNAPTNVAPKEIAKWFDAQVEPQLRALRAADFPVWSLAYPNNRHDEAVDRYVLSRTGFTHLRAGARGIRYNFKGDVTPETIVRFDTVETAYKPVEWAQWKPGMNGIGIGPVYCYSRENVFRALQRAAERNEAVTFFSHSIKPGNTDWVGMRTEWLEEILAEAKRLEIKVIGFDDL